MLKDPFCAPCSGGITKIYRPHSKLGERERDTKMHLRNESRKRAEDNGGARIGETMQVTAIHHLAAIFTSANSTKDVPTFLASWRTQL